MSTRASASLIRCFSLVISSNVDILHLRGRVLVDPDRSIFWVSRLLGTLRFPRFPRPSDTRAARHILATPVHRRARGLIPPRSKCDGGRRQIRSPLLGRLGRAYSRPFLNLFLFAQKTVDFGLHYLDSCLLPFCHCFSLFDEALDQQVLKLNDPGLLLWS